MAWDPPDLLCLWHTIYRLINIELPREIEKNLKVVSNVGWYWINYVSEMMSQILNPKFICMTRPRQEVIDSFLAYMPEINHFTAADSKHWDDKKDRKGDAPWCWPAYDLPKAEAIGAYWDEYHKKAEFWAWKFPQNFRIFPVETLNSEKGVRDLLKFAGFPARGQVRGVGIKLNTRERPKGSFNPETNEVVYPEYVLGYTPPAKRAA